MKEKWRRINSVEYFKKGIEPKWEDPRNEKGGRFVFPVPRTQENKDELYQQLVFFLLGDCLLYTSPSPRDLSTSRMPSSA